MVEIAAGVWYTKGTRKTLEEWVYGIAANGRGYTAAVRTAYERC